jgi:thioredoxin
MRKLSSLSLGALLALSCTRGPQVPEPKHHVEHLGPAEFQTRAQAQQGLYLDVRTPGEVARGVIPGASVIDLNDARFDQKVALLDHQRPLFVYCASGGRSAAAAEMLVRQGFTHVAELEGGLGAWSRAGLPIERPAGPAPAADGLTPEAFDAQLKATSRVLVDYQTPWCTPCRAMAPVVDALAQEYEGRAKVLRVDVDQSEALAAREHVQGVPVFVLYVDGQERWRATGLQPKETLAAQLEAPKSP